MFYGIGSEPPLRKSLGAILGSSIDHEQLQKFANHMDRLIKMKVSAAEGFGSNSLLQPSESALNKCNEAIETQIKNIYTAKLNMQNQPQRILESIYQSTSNLAKEINQVLSSEVEITNEMIHDLHKAECSFLSNKGFAIIALGGQREFEQAEAKNKEGPKIITTAPQISHEEESKIRAELIKIFLIDKDVLDKINKELDPKILKNHEEKVWEAVSLIKSEPDTLNYLTEFKLAMDTLPEEVKSKLVPILYKVGGSAASSLSIPYAISTYVSSEELKAMPPTVRDLWTDKPIPLRFGPGCDLSNYYLMNIDFTNPYVPELNLSNANMSGADLTNSTLEKLMLDSANLKGANLTKTDLSGANLNGANLNGANLTNTDLRGASLVGAQLGGAYWEEGRSPLIDNKTKFILDDLLIIGKDVLPSRKLQSLIVQCTEIDLRDAPPSEKIKSLIRLGQIGTAFPRYESIEKIQNAFEGVSPKMKDRILKNIGLFQRRALEGILAYQDPDKKITAANIPLILPSEKGSIIIPDEQVSKLEAGITAANLIDTETAKDQSVKYNLALIKQQAARNNLLKVSGDHAKKDFSSPEITLFGGSFDQAVLDSANLSRKDLSEAVFNECRLIKTNLSGAKLQNTTFNNCDLSEVNLGEAKMEGTTFHNCNLSKSTWEKALMDGVSMINCTIKDVDIKEMTSHNWFLDHCILDNVNFKGSKEGKGIFINQMGLISSIIVNSNIEGNTNFYNIEGIGSVLTINDPAEKLLNKDLMISPLSYVNNSSIQIALEAVFQEGSIYSQALQNVEDNGVNLGPVNLIDLSDLSKAAIGYQPQRFIKVNPKLLKNMQ